jgi:hypothetical protein
VENRIFENMSDVGRGTNLVGVALMAVSSAVLFISRAVATRKPRRDGAPDTTVVDMQKTQSN